jgi:hypothetical protein
MNPGGKRAFSASWGFSVTEHILGHDILGVYKLDVLRTWEGTEGSSTITEHWEGPFCRPRCFEMSQNCTIMCSEVGKVKSSTGLTWEWQAVPVHGQEISPRAREVF